MNNANFDRAEREYFNRLEDDYNREDEKCLDCDGDKYLVDKDNEQYDCPKCDGTGIRNLQDELEAHEEARAERLLDRD